MVIPFGGKLKKEKNNSDRKKSKLIVVTITQRLAGLWRGVRTSVEADIAVIMIKYQVGRS